MNKFIGDKQFYKRLFSVAIPIMIQNGITNFVGLLDNIMVGQIGTEQMSGVAIVNQLIFVFNLAIFGAISGPGIFTAQYVGQKNDEGVRFTVRFKLLIATFISLVGIVVLCNFQNQLIGLFLHEQANQNLNLTATLEHAKEYLYVMLFGLFPFAISQSYAGTLRESGETKVPMVAGLIAVGVNLVLNYVLIFGYLGAPALGVVGAAIATVFSRLVEASIIIVWTHVHTERVPFANGLFTGFYIPSSLLVKIVAKGTPLFFNELLWSLGMSALTQCYSTRGLAVVAAFNISNTIVNLFNVVLLSMGSVVAIIIGQELGAGNLDTVVDTDRKLIFAAVVMSGVMGLLLILFAPLFPKLYVTSEAIRVLAVKLMRLAAVFMPIGSFLNTAYFTLRSGGKTFITFLFDSVFLWAICWPVAFALSRFTDIPIIPMYAIVLSLELLKVCLGAILLKKRVWIQNIVETD